jgi:hypothetical protein
VKILLSNNFLRDNHGHRAYDCQIMIDHGRFRRFFEGFIF